MVKAMNYWCVHVSTVTDSAKVFHNEKQGNRGYQTSPAVRNLIHLFVADNRLVQRLK